MRRATAHLLAARPDDWANKPWFVPLADITWPVGDRRCHVCRHPLCPYINTRLRAGESPNVIYDAISQSRQSGDPPPPSITSIRNHRDRHPIWLHSHGVADDDLPLLAVGKFINQQCQQTGSGRLFAGGEINVIATHFAAWAHERGMRSLSHAELKVAFQARGYSYVRANDGREGFARISVLSLSSGITAGKQQQLSDMYARMAREDGVSEDLEAVAATAWNL